MYRYEINIADYLLDTIGLSMAQDGAYMRLLNYYYRQENPLPLDFDELCGIARATSNQDKNAVKFVILKFFTQQPDGYHQGRADRVIAEYQASGTDEQQRKANERERQNRARAKRKALFDHLRSIGIAVKWNATTEELSELLKAHHTHVTRDDRVTVTENECDKSCDDRDGLRLNREPRTVNQEPEEYISPNAVTGYTKINELGSRLLELWQTNQVLSTLSTGSIFEIENNLRLQMVDRTDEEIIEAVENYATILGTKGKYFYTFKDSLANFLKKNIEKFYANMSPFENFLIKKFQGSEEKAVTEDKYANLYR